MSKDSQIFKIIDDGRRQRILLFLVFLSDDVATGNSVLEKRQPIMLSQVDYVSALTLQPL